MSKRSGFRYDISQHPEKRYICLGCGTEADICPHCEGRYGRKATLHCRGCGQTNIPHAPNWSYRLCDCGAVLCSGNHQVLDCAMKHGRCDDYE